jgi:LacI family transcriptional regulator
MGRTKGATVASIARAAGVSSATVSLVLNNRGDQLRINPETQERIRRIAKRMKYQPHPLARGLAGARTHSISVMWSMGGAHLSGRSGHIVRPIAVEAQERGYVLQLSDHLNDVQVILDTLQANRQRAVDGIIIEMPPDLHHNEQILETCQAFDAVVFLCHRDEPLPFDHVVQKRGGAFGAVARHFVNSGRQRLGFIVGTDNYVNTLKVDHFINQAEHLGLDRRAIDVHRLPPAGEGRIGPLYRQVLEKAYPGGCPLDALLCSTDEGAAWAMTWLKDQGLRIPEDVALCGVNDTEIARVLNPPLASIARGDTAMIKEANRMLYRRLDDGDAPYEHREIAMQFVWRESAGGDGDMSGN